jgi:hypothetical protein
VFISRIMVVKVHNYLNYHDPMDSCTINLIMP